ncbi:MAG: protein-glutamate O-methyltransferase CheR [Pseudomonadota bacterium]
MSHIAITDREFALFQRFIFDAAGITMSPTKKALVSGRLSKRVLHHHCGSFADYFRLIERGGNNEEVQLAVDLLTTNETYFFREKKHFDLLRKLAQAARADSTPFRVWSAACSSGEEVYSIAMVLADCLEGRAWEVLGSDLSARVLRCARAGHYKTQRTDQIPPDYLRRYCLRGIGEQDGTLLIDPALRQRVQFAQVNLNAALPQLGPFDVVFLRNVMIYFSNDTKRQVVARVTGKLKPGGHLFIGHSESLSDLDTGMRSLGPAIYRKE